MHVKLVITDLDGTALDSPIEKVSSPRLAQAVIDADAAGIKVCAATGRPVSFAMPVLTSMGLSDPAIVAGGSRIINPKTTEKLWGVDISREDLEAVLAVIKPYDIKVLWNDNTEQDYAEGGWEVDGLKTHDGIHFFELCFVPNELSEQINKQLNEIDGVTASIVKSYHDDAKDIHIINKAATKEHAIYELQKMLGISVEQTVGVGDGHNDIHLFNGVGHKVAMNNAVQDLKDQADEIIGDVKEDGLAEFIEKLVSNGGEL
jgi:Cof subfamily protein (haloacid dehalogenase superfamily)